MSGINPQQLREYVVRPALRRVGLWSEAAENLLMGTAAQESHMGTYIKQLGSGPAMGIYQKEPVTHVDIWGNYLRYQPELRTKILALIPPAMTQSSLEFGDYGDVSLLMSDLQYATVMARVHYRRVKEPLPAAGDVYALAHYWKEHYNTVKGKGTVAEFCSNYAQYVTP